MKTVIIKENTYKKLFENIEDEIYSTPDTIHMNDEYSTFLSDDAIPFFVMPNNKVIVCKPKTTHKDYYNAIHDNVKRRQFINSVILQGRYWKDKNIFSFWKLNSDDVPYVRAAVSKLWDNKRDGFIYYKDKIYQIMNDDGRIWFSQVHDYTKLDENPTLDDAKEKLMKHWFKSDGDFVKRNYQISTYSNGKTESRPLNDYEQLCATCYQVWTDFLRANEKHGFTTEEFKLFIDLKTHGRHSLDELLDYFHNNMRRKLVNAFDINGIGTTIDTDNSNDLILDLLDRLEIDDTQYDVTYYQDSDIPYSYNIKIVNDGDKFKQLLGNAKTSDKFIVDRLNIKKIHNDKLLCRCRIRLKPEFDKYWNKNG